MSSGAHSVLVMRGTDPQDTVMWTGCNVVFRILICTSNTGTLKDGGVPVGLFYFLGEGSLFAWGGYVV